MRIANINHRSGQRTRVDVAKQAHNTAHIDDNSLCNVSLPLNRLIVKLVRETKQTNYHYIAETDW